MIRRGHIDRKKHEVDIAERVLEGGVWAGPGQFDHIRNADLNFRVQVWPLASVAWAVQVHPLKPDTDD